MKINKRLMSRREFLTLTAGGAGAAAILAACGPAPTSTSSTAVPAAAAETIVGAPDWWLNKHTTLYQLADEYNGQFPDRPPVKLLKFSLDFAKALLEAKEGTSSVDTIAGAAGTEWNVPLLEGEVYQPIDDVFPADIKSDLGEGTLADAMYKDQLYLFPVVDAGTSVGYRKSMLSQAGYEGGPPDAMEEWPACLEAIQQNVKASDGSLVYGVTWDPASSWRAESATGLAMLGYEGYFSEDPEQIINWDNPGMVDVLEFLKSLVPYSPPEIFSPGQEYVDVFTAGKAAMMWTAEGRPVEIAQRGFGLDDLGLAVPPGPANPIQGDGSIRGTASSDGFYFFKHGAGWKEALDFYVWAYQQDSFHISLATQGGWTPASKRAASIDGMPAWVGPMHDILARQRPFPASPHVGTYLTVWPATMVAYLQGQISTPQEALQKGKDDLAAAIAQQ